MKSYIIALLCMSVIFSQTALAATSTEEQLSMLSSIKAQLERILAALKNPLNQTSSEDLVAAVVVSAGTEKGQRAQLKTSLSSYPVRASALNTSKILGYQAKNMIGTISQITTQTLVTYPPGCNQQISNVIASTCTPTYTYLKWARINFDTGVDGWVEHKYLTPAVSTQFNIDTTLVTKASTPVYSSPTGSTLGTQPANATGVTSGAPISSGGKIWWPVNYTSGVDGWVDQAAIRNIGVEIPTTNLSIHQLPFPLPTDPNILKAEADKIGVPVEALNYGLEKIIENGEYTVLTNGPIQIVQVTTKGAAMVDGLNVGTLLMYGQDDEGNYEVAVLDEYNGGASIRQNVDTPDIQIWTIIDKSALGGTVEGKFAVSYVDVGYDQIYITISQVNDDGSTNILTVSDPLSQIDISNVVWKTPDVCKGGCGDMPEWGAVVTETPDGYLVKTGLGEAEIIDFQSDPDGYKFDRGPGYFSFDELAELFGFISEFTFPEFKKYE